MKIKIWDIQEELMTKNFLAQQKRQKKMAQLNSKSDVQ